MEVKRYLPHAMGHDPLTHTITSQAIEHPQGVYVRASDYDALEAENKLLRHQIRESCDEMRHDPEQHPCPLVIDLEVENKRLAAELADIRARLAEAERLLRKTQNYWLHYRIDTDPDLDATDAAVVAFLAGSTDDRTEPSKGTDNGQ